MGKSLGNILEPRKLLAAYGSDAVRFYFLKEVVFGQARPFLAVSCHLIALEGCQKGSSHLGILIRQTVRGCPFQPAAF